MEGDCAPKRSDGSDRQAPQWQPTELRSDTAIEVVRYELEHQASAESL
jgi:hypothetical protein